MRKLIRFFIAVCLVLLFTVTVNAETFDTSLSVRETSSKYVCLDAFIGTDSPICGGEFTLDFNEDFALFGNIESDAFDVEACDNNGELKIIVAKDEGAKLGEGEPAFSVKLSTVGKEDFSVTLKTEYIINDKFEKNLPEIDVARLEIDGDSVSVSDEPQKAKASESVEKDKSTINEKVSVDKESDKNTEKKSLSPIKIDEKDRGIGLILAVGLLLVVAFLFGLFFKKIMTSKEEEDPIDLL